MANDTDGFALADVRDSFALDITRSLDDIAGAMRAGGRWSAAEAAEAARVDEALRLAAHHGHAIVGTSALVGAESLARVGELIERIAAASRDFALEAARCRQHLADLCVTGSRIVAEARDLLALELADRRGDAATRSQALCSAVAETIAGLPQSAPSADPLRVVEGGPSDAETSAADREADFDFVDEVAAPEPASGLDVVILPDEIAPVPDDGGIDPELAAIFREECGELLDALDRLCLAWDAEALGEARRLYHTLKGSAATVGHLRIHQVAHVIEDHLLAEPRDSSPTGVADALLQAQRALRGLLAGGEVVDADILALFADRASSTLQALTTSPSPMAPAAFAAGHATSHATDEDQQFVRVAPEQLDHLLAIAGELLLGRGRIEDRAQGLVRLQGELRAGRSRLVEIVDDFRSRNEFPSIGRARTAAAESGFGELEFDRYDDVHLLARQLAEIGDDIGEVQAQIQTQIELFHEESDGLGRGIAGLQEEATRLRMVPMRDLFARLRLAARDASRRSGRDAVVEVEGESVGLDKAIADRIALPLEHLVRNAFAHGFEADEDRLVAGKPPLGRLSLSARHDNGRVVIEVRDDGRGLDLAALRARGVELGLVAPATALDAPAIRDLVFAPGLSTRVGDDGLSGRGVGCDAVRRAVERLGGTVTVAHLPGQSATFTVTLPLTLAVMRALLVGCSDEILAIPLSYVERVVDLADWPVAEGVAGKRVKIGGVWMAARQLSEPLGWGASAGGGSAVVVRVGERRGALIVDRLLQQREVVVHGLGDLLDGHPLVTAVTIGANGVLVPILDAPGLIERLTRRTAVAVPQAAKPAVPSAMRVLYVDDSLSVRKVAQRTLSAGGWAVTVAGDGDEALDLLRRGGIDLVFTDLEMPRRNGLELIRAMAADPALRRIPAIVVSSRSADKHRAAATAAGAVGFLSKPFAPDSLLTTARASLPR